MPEIEWPEGAGYLVAKFEALTRCRRSGEAGPEPITYQDIAAYCQSSGDRLDGWEVEALIGMDQAFRAAMVTEIAADRARSKH